MLTVSRLTWDFKVTNISLDSHFLAWDDSAAVWGSWGVEGGDKLVRHRRNQPSKSASPERETHRRELQADSLGALLEWLSLQR